MKKKIIADKEVIEFENENEMMEYFIGEILERLLSKLEAEIEGELTVDLKAGVGTVKFKRKQK